MGKSRRILYKQELRRAINNIAWAITHLARVTEAYEEAHPEISEALLAVMSALNDLAELIASLEEKV